MITVDDRTQKDAPAFLAGLRTVLGQDNTRVARMEFGDIAFDGHPTADGRIPHIGIELATVADYLGKINSGRLAFQVNGLLRDYNVPVFLVEGILMPDAQGNVRTWGHDSRFLWETQQMARWSIEAHGVKFWSEPNRQEAIKRIIAIYRWWQKKPEEHTLLRRVEAEISSLEAGAPHRLDDLVDVRVGRTSLRGEREHGNARFPTPMPDNDLLNVPLGQPVDRVISAMCALVQNLGPQKSMNALKKAGSLDILCFMSVEKLAEIDGWGKVTARRFHDVVTKQFGG